jgi:ATP-dependent Lon protease
VILPKENEADLEDVPEEVRQQLVFHPVETLSDVLKIALAREPGSGAEEPEEEGIPATVG